MRFNEIIKESPTLTRNFQSAMREISQEFAQLHRLFISRRTDIELDGRYDDVMGELNSSFSNLEDLEKQNLKLNKG